MDYKNEAPVIRRLIRRLLQNKVLPDENWTFWAALSGGGANTAGTAGCPSFTSRKANKVRPVGMLPGGQNVGGINGAVLDTCRRDGCIRVFWVTTPSDDLFADAIRKIPGTPPTTELAVYLGLHHIEYAHAERIRDKQKIDTFLNDNNLGPSEEAYARYLTEWHYKVYLTSVRLPSNVTATTPTDLTQYVNEDDNRYIGVSLTPGTSVQNSLRLKHDDSIPINGLMQQFLDTEGWMQFSEQNGTDNWGNIHGISITVQNAIDASYHISVAGMARILQYNITEHSDGKKTAGALPDYPFASLGPLLQNIPMPVPNRLLDTTTSFIYAIFGSTRYNDLFRDTRIGMEMNDIMFSVLLIRITGCVIPWAAWCEAYRKERPNDPSLPPQTYFPIRRHQLHHFLGYLRRLNIAARLQGSMRLFISAQFSSCLAPSVHKLESFTNIALTFEQKVTDLVEKLQTIADRRDSGTRDEAVRAVATFLADNCSSDRMKKGAHLFVASTVIADLEELSDVPFGEVNKIYPAFGGRQGLEAVRIYDESGTELAGLSTMDKIRRIFDALQDACDDLIEFNGWERNEHGKIINSINKRPITYVDCEHICCKNYVFIVSTLPNRICNVRNPSRPNLHPLPDKKVNNFLKLNSTTARMCLNKFIEHPSRLPSLPQDVYNPAVHHIDDVTSDDEGTGSHMGGSEMPQPEDCATMYENASCVPV
jgi:hypothetical protein